MPPSDAKEEERKFQGARKKLISLLTWTLCDEKHRTLPQIKDTLQYLSRICTNVRDAPTEDKYRRIRASNATFIRHVADVPGGLDFLLTAGWHVTVQAFEKHFVFECVPGSSGWRLLEEACTELAKGTATVAAKEERAAYNKRVEVQQRLDSVRLALEDDKESRHARFRYQGDAAAPPPVSSPPAARGSSPPAASGSRPAGEE